VRIHFTAADLARTRLAGEPSRLAIAAFSLMSLPFAPGPAEVDLWRRAVRVGLAGRRPSSPGCGTGGDGRWGTSLLRELAGPGGPVPRLLRPAVGAGGIEEELDRMAATPRAALAKDLAYVARQRPMPRWSRALAVGELRAMDLLAAEVRAYYAVAVKPYWRVLHRALAADRAARARQLCDGGVEAVLCTLSPRLRWRSPVLEAGGPGGPDYDLGGRGLLLAPGPFVTYVPCDPAEGQPTLYYEAGQYPVPEGTAPPALLIGPDGPPEGLAALLGHGRAAVLQAVAEGASTSQLARRAGLSAASASEHATVLRRAGLLVTRRDGRFSHHTLTALGTELLLHVAVESAGSRAPSRS
jgi:DNA-binding transcriptional ArsR family regulator